MEDMAMDSEVTASEGCDLILRLKQYQPYQHFIFSQKKAVLFFWTLLFPVVLLFVDLFRFFMFITCLDSG